MHRNISINTLSLPAGDTAAHVEAVARLGARAISPDLSDILAFAPARAGQVIRDAGLAVATLTHRAFGFATPGEMAEQRERLMQTLDIAATLGAQSIIMTTGGRGGLTWSDAASRFAEAIAPCAERARVLGIALGIEQTSHLYADASITHRLTDGVAVAQLAGIAVIIDIFACWVDSDIETAIAAAGPLCPLVQISDHVPGDRALPCRAVPGDGAIPFERLIPAMVAAGIQGWYDLEIIGPRIAAEGHAAGLRRAASHIGALLELAGLPA